MDLSKIEELMKQSGKSVLGLRDQDAFLQNDYFKLKKSKMEVGKTLKRVVDLQLEFPFNPLDVNDGNFHQRRKFIGDFSPSSTIATIKNACLKDNSLKEFWEGISDKCIKFDLDAPLTKEEFDFFCGYLEPVHYHAYVYQGRLSSWGKYGRKFLADIKKDSKGEITQADIPYQVHEMELEFAYRDCKQIEDKAKLEGKTEVDIKEAKKARMKKVLISQPYKLGMMRCLEFEANKDGEIIAKVGDYNNYAKYFSGNTENLSKVKAQIGSKSHKCIDFIEYDIAYNEPIGVKNEADKILETYKQRVESFNPLTRITEQKTAPGFLDKYIEYRDNQDFFKEEVILRSVYEYKPVDPDSFLSLYKENITDDKKQLIDAEISAKFKGLLSKMRDDVISDYMIEATIDEKVVEKAKDAEYKDVNEDQSGAGITEVDEEALTDFLK